MAVWPRANSIAYIHKVARRRSRLVLRRVTYRSRVNRLDM